MKVNKVKDGVEIVCFGETHKELMRSLHDSVVLASGAVGKALFENKPKPKKKRAAPKKKKQPEPTYPQQTDPLLNDEQQHALPT